MAKRSELRGVTLAGLALVSVLVLELIRPEPAGAFPSLFNVRSHSIFRRQQQQQQHQQQHQPQPHPTSSATQPQEQLMALGNEPSFGQHQFGAARPLPVELMRISSVQQHAALPAVSSIGAHQLHQALISSAASHPHQQRQFSFADSVEHDDQFAGPVQSAGFFMPAGRAAAATAAAAAARQPAMSSGGDSLMRPASQSAAFELSDSQGDYFSSPESVNVPSEPKSSDAAASGQLRHEPSHTSEIVDKIEQHIGQQVQHSLQQHAAASGYQQHAEKEAAPHEAAHEEAAGGSGGESGGHSDEEENKMEKRHEADESSHKEPAEHHHVEHPPEAFEVHHKKGGKSFQYFHMGHQHQ